MLDEALRHPVPTYALGTLLARLRRELTMIEVPEGYFDVDSFAADGNCQVELLKPALRLSEAGCTHVAERTEGFSFAYIQEVFVSSMMRWMNQRDAAGILAVALEQIELLRAQMQSAPPEEPGPTEPAGPPLPPWMRYMMGRRR